MNKRNIIGGPSRPEKRELAGLLRDHATEAESILWQYLRAGRLAAPHWRRQQVIDGFIVDFYCHRAVLVLELDGPVHETRKEYDAERDLILSQRGLRILRIPNSRVTEDLPALLADLKRAIESTT